MARNGFFDRQTVARRNTAWLVMLFLIAVTLISSAVCVVGYLVTRSEYTDLPFQQWLLTTPGWATALAVVGLIGAGSLVRWIDLSGGGEKVAQMVNARLIDPSTSDSDERRLRNVVEEMAIASGVPVPQLYIMDQETGINAFVAGYSPTEAVMVVTHGTITDLNRDELQGVIGHEFSHILNGDMRLNVRLISFLAGILMIGQVGTFLLRGFSVRSSRSSRRNQHGAVVIVALALTVIGYVGVFFGRLIQAAVSRQRETLADASSVQFTRNPDGIAGALYKIGLKGGYLDTTRHASEMNHMCIGESARMKFTRLLASHPPIEQRIEAIQPGMMARLRSRLRDTTPTYKTRIADAATEPDAGITGAFRQGVRSVTAPLTPGAETPALSTSLSQQAGVVTEASEAYAYSFLKNLPATFRSLLYTRAGAIQLCYGLLISGLEPTEQQRRLALLSSKPLFAPQADLLDKLLPTLAKADGALGFPALELAMPALRKLDPAEIRQLISEVTKLVRADGRVSLFEFALITFLQRHLGEGAMRSVPVRYRSYRKVGSSLRQLFGLIARAGSDRSEEADRLYQNAIAGFFNAGEPPGPRPEKVTLRQLKAALEQLNQLSPMLKPAIIDACGQCVLGDQKVTVGEYDLLRLIVDQLDCPMPPLQIKVHTPRH